MGPVEVGELSNPLRLSDSQRRFFYASITPIEPSELLVRALRSHRTHRTRYYSSGQVISPSQRPKPNNTRHSQETGLHAPGEIRTCIPRKRAAADPRLTRRDHRDRPQGIYSVHIVLAVVFIILLNMYRFNRLQNVAAHNLKNINLAPHPACHNVTLKWHIGVD